MNKNLIKFGVFLLGAILLLTIDGFAQYRHHPAPRYRPIHQPRPRISVGMGGFFGFGSPYRYGYGPGVSMGIMLPPIGVTIHSLPPGSRRVYYGGSPYYYRNNTYYQSRDRGGYEMVEPPLGATLYRLPPGARLRKINGQPYYEFEGLYFEPIINESGEKSYLVVGKNGELETQRAREQWQDANRMEDAQVYENQEESTDPSRATNDQLNQPETSNNNRAMPQASMEVKPEAGDQFEQLPRDSKKVYRNGETQYLSPAGTYYKEVTLEGKKWYEVTGSR